MKTRTPPALAALVALTCGLGPLQAQAQSYSGDRYPGQAYPSPPGSYRDGVRPNPYEDGYRAGYRAGFQAARQGAAFNDRPGSFGYPGQGPGPGAGPGAYPGPGPGPYDGGADPERRWRARYGQTYSVADDRYYQECRDRPDPGGVIVGALIGGLLGNAAGRGGARPATTVAGIVVGGAVGAALTKRLDCEDRSYAYKTYSQAFNSGRPRSDWQWENPNNGHYGDFRIGDYYSDQDGFRCANYTQQIWVEGQPQAASGRACRQPDGTWAIVG